MSELLALVSSLLWGTSDFLGGTATRRRAAYAVVGASQALALVVLVPIAVAVRAWQVPADYLLPALAAGAFGLVGLTAFYTALAAGTMGVVAPVAATGVIVPVLVGLAAGDAPGLVQLVGMAAACGGVVLASGPERGTGRQRATLQPLLLALVAAGGFGAALVFLARGAEHSVVMTLVAMRAESVAVFGLGAGAVLAGGRRIGLTRTDLPVLATIGFGDAAANGTYALATRSGALSVVAVLGSLYPAVTVVLAREVHGERLRPVQSAGVGAALAGVVLIAAGGGTG